MLLTNAASLVLGSIAPFSSPCKGNLGDELGANLTSLESGQIRAKLDQLYNTIRRESPYAQVVVVSYPRFFPRAGASWLAPCQGVRISDQMWMNDATIRADLAIGLAAIAHDFSYVNMENALGGHEQCTSDPWINGLKFISPSKGVAAPESYHPNAGGHASMAEAIRPVLQQDLAPTDVIRPGQNISRAIYVTGDAFHVNVAWPGSDVVTSLTSPSGVVYTRTAPGAADHDYGPTWESYHVKSPEVGTWTVSMFGADVAVNGESVRLSTAVEQPANQPPTAVIAMTGNGLTYHFDASTSTDTDGVVASYLWDFGDGTYSTSAVVDHTYPAGQEYVPTLAVTDDGGRVGVASASRSVGAVGTSIGQSVTLTNSTKITGPVHVKGDFNCNSNAGILGDIDVTGSAYLTNSCHIAGSLRVAGTVQMYSSPAIDGSIIAGGDVRFQSTAKVGGSVVTAGSFVSVDGTTSADLNSNGRIVGQIVEGATLPAVVQPPVASTQADPALWPNSATRSWAQWMNDTARANAAPSWSVALTSDPGCTMAPWGSSVNGAVAQVSGNTIIDARSGCSSVTLQNMEVKIAGDVTIIANGFSSVNGLTVSSADGRPHSFTVVTAGDRSCSSSSSGAVNLSAATTSDSNVTFGVDSSGRVTINGTSKLSGRVTAPCLSASGTVSIGG